MSRKYLFLWLVATLISAIVATIAFPDAVNRLADFSSDPLLSIISTYGNEQENDPVIIYSAMLEDQVVEYVSAFRATHPDIDVTYEVFATNELAERIIAERTNPQADVIWGLSATTLQQLDWYDVLFPYAPVGLYRIPTKLRDVADPPAWVGHDVWMNAFCVNTHLLAEASLPVPTSWADLLDPMYAEMIDFPNPSASGTGYMTLLVFLELYGEQELWEVWDQLDANVSNYNDSASAGCQAAADDEVAIAVSYGLAAVSARDNNSNIVVIFPEEGSGWDMEAAALVRNLPVRPESKVLMDYIISDAAMHYYGQHYAVTSVPVSYLRPPIGFPAQPLDQLFEKNFLWEGANRNRLTRVWHERYGE